MGTITTLARFSQRERQIVGGLLEAKAVKDIAIELELSVNTVKDYVKTIYRKAQVHSARELMLQLAPRDPTPDTALAQLLHTVQSLDPSPLPGEALAQLAGAIQRCTRAQRVNFWRLVRGPAGAYLASEQGAGTLAVGAFASRILERGWARLDGAELRTAEARHLAAAGLRGEVLGISCAPTPRVHLLLAGDPVDGTFGPLDLATMRLLSRLVQGVDGRHLTVMSATA